MKEDDLDRLQIPLMVNQKENEELSTALTITVGDDHTPPHIDFNRPGHIFPLIYREGGVLRRAGHTEAFVDLAVLAGLDPVAVLCEVVDDDDGSVARLPKLREFAERESLKIVCIADLIRYRRKRTRLVGFPSAARLPTMWGEFKAYWRVPLAAPINKENQRYLEAKQAKMGHVYGSHLKSRFRRLIDNTATGNNKAANEECPKTNDCGSR
ncbi:hypothetical protein SAY87_014441 [Trapa incisa]|uniref:3,4-dihydroxy-2-butanone-4-phosphate synthase n=1 Tax=Trapa incisa TaxID=236973 RepID=A0AAN7GWT4_9MYRT|nr:hypothetical protein SAY87_014441 [Trapa incisa]